MTVMTPTLTGALTLGHVLEATGLDLDEVVVLRHTFTEGGLESAADLTPEKVLDYTRVQGIHGSKLGPAPPRHWLVFMADGGRRSRLLVVYDNHGEMPALRSQRQRVFDLQPSAVLSSLVGRLLVEWSRDTVNWAKRGVAASALPVVEIADPKRVPFPGFDRVLISHTELRDVVEDSRYSEWRTPPGPAPGGQRRGGAALGPRALLRQGGEWRQLRATRPGRPRPGARPPLPVQHPAGLRAERADHRGRPSRNPLQTCPDDPLARPQPQLARHTTRPR